MTPAPLPIAAVLSVVVHQGRVLLVRRANPPSQGLWGMPGGRIESGETLFAAAERELEEETGIQAEAVRLLDVRDLIEHAPDRTLRHHFILLAIACRWRSGMPQAADDALDAAWFTPDQLQDDDPMLVPGTVSLARQALLAWPGLAD